MGYDAYAKVIPDLQTPTEAEDGTAVNPELPPVPESNPSEDIPLPVSPINPSSDSVDIQMASIDNSNDNSVGYILPPAFQRPTTLGQKIQTLWSSFVGKFLKW